MKLLLASFVHLYTIGQIMSSTPPSSNLNLQTGLASAEKPSCMKSGCGPNAVCIVRYLTLNTTTSYCTCKRGGYFGDPNIGCVAECESGSGCGGGKICSRNECVDPCPGYCGDNMICEVKNYRPTCTCMGGYHNIPGHSCIRISEPLPTDVTSISDPCEPSPCGQYAFCSRKTYRTVECTCIHKTGTQPPNCRPQCTTHSDCPADKYCSYGYCEDSKGQPQPPSSACTSDRCGPFSEKVIIGNRRICKCLPGYYGNPPNCTCECTQNSDCPLHRSCHEISRTCVNPCEGACAKNSMCTVQNHTPVCSCSSDADLIASDPFKACYYSPVLTPPHGVIQKPINFCHDPVARCGQNAKCNQENNRVSCTCLDGFGGAPPNCYRECGQNSECPSMKACVNSTCIYPCENNFCGAGGECNVVNHVPVCTCDPKLGLCSPLQKDPCIPSSCGQNTTCDSEVNGQPCCRCLPNFFGDPAKGCRPACYGDEDCPSNNACVKNSCVDPCRGTCGRNAFCSVVDHRPHCNCQNGLVGDPFVACEKPRI